ncbi:acetate/propionate family kinase [Sphingobium sp. DC-2]|uniref:acetate/propionate family kinase n=1 Tax=Sphingobium sp. DC-2 TaxID=1303256 RepID=UPI0004C37D91|nr:acetate/propionate family kinase [Sphingobium sp. DC-2]
MTAVASLNAGSSSIKFALYTADGVAEPALLSRGKIEKIGIAPRLVAHDAGGELLHEREWPDGRDLTHDDLLEDLFNGDVHPDASQVSAVGHRVVHGGIAFAAPHLVDETLLDALDRLCPLAPLHQPHNLAAIRALWRLAPKLKQVACFDTAFHHDMPTLATRFAIPRALHDQGIRRYGFHGLSYEYVARRLAEVDPVLASGRTIVAHLGNGASLCAMHGGKSVDTTMGFTALDGLMMGTRCGNLDPGVVLHLLMQMDMDAAAVEDLLYHRSGLLGVSGISSDMRTLSADGSPEAEEAIDLFAWRVAREAGALASSLGGIDGFVFTAGIGENHAEVRSRICQRLAWLGTEIDEIANASDAPRISLPSSAVTVRIVPTDEELMIALHTLSLIGEAA